jgi:hypothetical protein
MKGIPGYAVRELNRERGSGFNVYFDEDYLVIEGFGELSFGLINTLLIKLNLVQDGKEYTGINLLLDFSKVYHIRPAAAMGTLCLCSALSTNKIKGIINLSGLYLRRPCSEVLTYLATIGFFTQMSMKAELLGCEDLVRDESRMDKYRKSKIEELRKRNLRAFTSDAQIADDNKSIVWPMEAIQKKGESIRERDFEDLCRRFINHARDYFEGLFSSSHFNFAKNDLHDFWEANVELYTNIFEHSDSWGLGMIHAQPDYGTTVCYHDIGVGIKGSLNSSPKLGKEFERFETDKEAMKWALNEGHSSKLSGISGNGIGLNIVEDFILSKSGNIEIRSGQCLLYKKPGDRSGSERWRCQNVSWFPGTQINFFVPCVTKATS